MNSGDVSEASSSSSITKKGRFLVVLSVQPLDVVALIMIATEKEHRFIFLNFP